jgi:biofilm PGA synthesis N-glycosyltransferase PgaC
MVDAAAPPSILLVSPGAREAPAWRRFYVSLPVKFALALLAATAWMALSIVLSRPWVADLSRLLGPAPALLIIAFIAYVPGFMNAFLLATILLDRRPARELPSHYPGITVLVACYNEAAHIGETLRSIALQGYPGELEVLVLDDGSTDGTAETARAAIRAMDPGDRAAIRVVEHERNAGKATVLNHGLQLASHELVATVDGDSWLYAFALQRAVERMISDPPGTKAVAGSVLVRNAEASWLTRAQQWDYFHGIAAVKRMQSMYHGTLVAQGAFSLYERQAMLDIGGWPECVGEDIVASWALLQAGHRIGYAEDALLFTHAPLAFRQFALQRKRWSRGLIEAFRHHARLLLKPRLTVLFIWWNLLFLPLDFVYTFAFIPGIVLALFGKYYIVGIMTLAILPLSAVSNYFVYRAQGKVFAELGLERPKDGWGFVFYTLAYALLMQPVCVWGYFAELAGMRKRWETK